MRILFTHTGSWGTGSFCAMRSLASVLKKSGHEVRMVFPDNQQTDMTRTPAQQSDSYDCWRFPLVHDKRTINSSPTILPYQEPNNLTPITFSDLDEESINIYCNFFARKINQVIKEFKPDVIECEHVWIMDHVLNKLGYPYISVAHNIDQIGFLFHSSLRKIVLSSAHGAQRIIALSESVKRQCVELYGIGSDKVCVIPEGYDQDVFYPMNHEVAQPFAKMPVNVPEDAVVITYAGGVNRTKGIDVLLRANKLLSPNLNIHFVIMGVGAIEKALDIDVYHEYEFNRVHFVGYHDQMVVNQLHNAARLFVCPSRSEGFGIGTLEAMACGKPAVVTRCGSPENFAVGEVVDNNDPQALALAITRLLTCTDKEYGHLSRLARQAADQFSWQELLAKRMAIYDEVVTNRGVAHKYRPNDEAFRRDFHRV